MNNILKGTCTIRDSDSDSDSYVTLDMQTHGHIKVDGLIGGTHRDHYMKFLYILDQTILIKLIKFFASSLQLPPAE